MAYTLRRGDTGLDVQKVQYYLNQVLAEPNLQTLTEDGNYGIRTEFGVVIFQYVFGLPVDGVVGNTTWDRLIEEFKALENPTSARPVGSRTLSVGSSGLGVEKMQAYLNRLVAPNPPLVVDGKFGNATRQAVMSFQARNNLNVDGIIGRTTWDVIINQL